MPAAPGSRVRLTKSFLNQEASFGGYLNHQQRNPTSDALLFPAPGDDVATPAEHAEEWESLVKQAAAFDARKSRRSAGRGAGGSSKSRRQPSQRAASSAQALPDESHPAKGRLQRHGTIAERASHPAAAAAAAGAPPGSRANSAVPQREQGIPDTGLEALWGDEESYAPAQPAAARKSPPGRLPARAKRPAVLDS